jgi:hypothetical protein
MSMTEVSGSWTYRSFNPTYVTGDQTPQKELELILAEADLRMDTPTSPTGLEGTIEWPGGGLDLKGTVLFGERASFDIVGAGRSDSNTAGWEYEYHGHLTSHWPKPRDANRVDQRPTIVGSVIRAKPHGESPAGSVYSFIAVKQRQPDGTLTSSPTGLWTYRSFHNNPTYVYPTAPQTARELILQEAVFKLEAPTSTTLQGTIEWPGGVLDIDFSRGTLRPAEGGEPPRFTFAGTGRPGTETAGWEYYYDGHLTRQWPNGVDQRPALVA